MVQKIEDDKLCQLLLRIFLYTSPDVYKEEFKVCILTLKIGLAGK